jgi:hypothetical protein
MKAKPLHNYKLLGTDIVLDHSKSYGFSHATNQPNWKEKGLIFIHERKDDPVGVLLEAGEYVIV